MPLLDVKRDELYWQFFFLNCYISIKEYPKLDKHFFLLFKFKSKDAYNTVKETLTNNKLFKEELSHSTKSGDYNIFVFNIPKKAEEDVKLFKNGKYSKLSTEYKNTIMRIHLVKQNKPLFHILNKTKSRRIKLSEDLNYEIPEDVDLWSIPHDYEEVLTLNELK
jgi:hypothetical protein